DRDPQSLRVPNVLRRTEPGLRRVARDDPPCDHHRRVVRTLPHPPRTMISKRLRSVALTGLAALLLSGWIIPVVWGLLTSFKTERDVLAYPPKIIFTPTLNNYREVLFGSASILPNLMSSLVVTVGATILTMLFAIPAAYALARLDLPAKRGSGFYVLATQMLPPVGLIIPYYLVLQKIGALDTYSGLTVIYLTFSLPFAIWLMVSYFEDVQ